jgi:hypothetical protein
MTADDRTKGQVAWDAITFGAVWERSLSLINRPMTVKGIDPLTQ